MADTMATGFDQETLKRLQMLTALPASNPASYVQKLENVRGLLADGQGLYPEISVETTQAYYAWMVERLVKAIRRDGRSMVSRYDGIDAVTGEAVAAGNRIIWSASLRLAMRI